ncbi:putative RNA-directed DNA polymerase from transposon X-element [Trichonephila clavipes]|nr:putative RNA-directed DNA polymerase from transposon X-element [Trichonephila clavipes]
MRDFIDKHAPDTFLIQETHLRPEHSFKIPNYSCYRNDRTHPSLGWGGTVILIKNCISHYHVPTPPQFTGVEMTLIMLTPIDHEPILIGSTYIPPTTGMGGSPYFLDAKGGSLWEPLEHSGKRPPDLRP